MNQPFEKEEKTQERARQIALSGSVAPSDYEELLRAYEGLLLKAWKIVRIGDATQSKFIRARRGTERAIQKFRETADQKEEILDLIVHDLKNRASPLVTLTETLLEDLPEAPEHVREILTHLHESSNGIVNSVNDALERESSRSKNLNPQFEWCDMRELYAGVIERNRAYARTKNTTLNIRPCAPFEARVDELLLREVFDNLINNAVKFTPGGKTIEVSLKPFREADGTSFARFMVIDEGPGLTEEDSRRLFRDFGPLSAKPTGSETSTGLGLSLAKKIVDLHRGRITGTNAVGRGANFTVVIPIDAMTEEEAAVVRDGG